MKDPVGTAETIAAILHMVYVSRRRFFLAEAKKRGPDWGLEDIAAAAIVGMLEEREVLA